MTEQYRQLSDRQVANLARITLSYVTEEDRVQLVGEDAEGKTIKLWLTARLLTRLVSHLVHHQAALGEVAQSVAVQPASKLNAEKDAESVSCKLGSPEVLVTEISIKVMQEGLALVFKESAQQDRASFLMSATALSSWNEGLRTCFEQAGWPQESFSPENNSPVTEPKSSVTIH